MCLELTVKLKDEDGERSFTLKKLVYEQLTLNLEGEFPDEDLQPYIDEAIKQFGEEPSEIRLSIKKEIKSSPMRVSHQPQIDILYR